MSPTLCLSSRSGFPPPPPPSAPPCAADACAVAGADSRHWYSQVAPSLDCTMRVESLNRTPIVPHESRKPSPYLLV